MSELIAQLTEWRDAVLGRLPPWWPRAVAAVLIVIGILLPFAFAQASGFLDATIKALAFVVMALGLNIVVGFAGLLDLGYVAFYALYQTTIWYFQGFEAGLIAFTAAVMGGIGNVRGAVLGGLIIGIIQQLSDARFGPEWTGAVVFAYLILIMVLRPHGLLGEETREAG